MFLSRPGRRPPASPFTPNILWRRFEIRLQEGSRYLSGRLSGIRRTRLRLALLVTAMVWGAACVAITRRGLGGMQKIPSLTTPSLPAMSSRAASGDSGLARAKARLARTRDYLDSVRARDPARYHHLKDLRPGLFDSLDRMKDILSP
jgi:hypothetical protein